MITRTAFTATGLRVGDRELPFYAGAMHYWRVPRARWSACLRAMHDTGFTIVETYVPWRVHAPAANRLDFTGDRDLAGFLDMAEAAGLAVVIRPGPHVNAELTSFGMPDWVLAEPACQARTARGTPAWMPTPPRAWPIPSYASAAFRAHVASWFAAVGDIVAPKLAPDGPVVAIGVDNEAQMFFRLGAFDLDYHPDAVAWWRESSGLDGEPPRDASDPARAALWVRFKDDYLARALGEFSRMLDAAGLAGVARFHNFPPGHHGLYDIRKLQAAIGGPVGIDAYSPRSAFPEIRRRALACTGNAAPIPIAFEVGVGFFPWFPPLDGGSPGTPPPDGDVTRERDHLLTLLAGGIRGFNLFMAVERDRYYGAAIARDGRVEAHAAWIKPLLAALAEVDWPSLRRVGAPAIALVDCKADARFGIATNLLDPMTPALVDALGLGPAGVAELGSDAGAIAARRWQTAVARALELAQLPYAIVDEATPEDELASYRAVIAPTGDRIDRGLAQRLRAVAEHKKAIVVIGPGTPTKDELDQPFPDALPRRVGRLREGSLDDLAGLAADLAKLAPPADDAWQIERSGVAGPRSPAEGRGGGQIERVNEVRVAAFADPSGKVRAVIATSDAPRAVTATLLADATVLRDPFTGERIRVDAGRATIAMPPRAARLLIVD
nr:beta-galactosidase [Kofleriaceae bacterium]